MTRRLLTFLFMLVFILSISSCSLTVEKDKSELRKPASNVSDADLIIYKNTNHGYSLAIPGEWEGRYILEEGQDVTRFIYKSIQHPEYRSNIFAVSVYTLKQWEKVKDEPDYGSEIGRNSKYVYAYTIGLDNSYEGNESEEYREMVQSVYLLMNNFKIEQN